MVWGQPNFYTTVNFFKNQTKVKKGHRKFFFCLNSGQKYSHGSGSVFISNCWNRICINFKCLIRIRNKWMRIQNPAYERWVKKICYQWSGWKGPNAHRAASTHAGTALCWASPQESSGQLSWLLWGMGCEEKEIGGSRFCCCHGGSLFSNSDISQKSMNVWHAMQMEV